MSPKKHFKIAIDALMFLLFLLLMGAHLTSAVFHEWLGIGLFICFLVHNILNYKWYKVLLKGKYTVRRTIQTTVNVLLLLAIIGCIISSLMISGVVFRDIRILNTQLGRELHMLCTAWGFVLMSIHLGLHIRMPKTARTFRIVFYAIATILTIYGVLVFAERKLWEELFLLSEYKWFDYDKTVLLYMFQTFAVSMGFTAITYSMKKLGLHIKEKRNAKKH